MAHFNTNPSVTKSMCSVTYFVNQKRGGKTARDNLSQLTVIRPLSSKGYMIRTTKAFCTLLFFSHICVDFERTYFWIDQKYFAHPPTLERYILSCTEFSSLTLQFLANKLAAREKHNGIIYQNNENRKPLTSTGKKMYKFPTGLQTFIYPSVSGAKHPAEFNLLWISAVDNYS